MVHIGVIGGGPAGLCVAHNALNAGHRVTLWEQCDQVGGTWVYSPKVGIHSSMYEVMKTNLPREGMAFPDTPFDTNLPSFLDHQHVLEYLQNYSRDIHEIQLNTKVVAVDRKEKNWKVKVQTNGEEKSHEVDALFICNGHFFEPNRPFDESKFEGTIIHSHDYRSNRPYAGKRVIMIGHGFSGIDIGCQIAEVAEMVYLVGHCKNPYNGFPKNLLLVEEDIEEIIENGVRTKDGNLIECDHIIVSTGYFYSYPFFSKSIVQIEEGGRVVRPLYLHYIHREFPRSLFFVGLNFIVVPFVLFHAQAQYALALIDGKCEVPSVEEMDKWEEKRLKALSNDDQPIRRYHMMSDYQWEYFDELSKRCQSSTPFCTPLVRKLFEYTINARRADVLNYKYVDFEVDGDEFKVKQK